MLFLLTLMGCLLDSQESTVKSKVLTNYIFSHFFLKMAPNCHLPWTLEAFGTIFSPADGLQGGANSKT